MDARNRPERPSWDSGLVMAAGGARAAYQAGVLKRIGELRALREGPSPFGILEGVSSGAINACGLAAGADDFGRSTRLLAELWSHLSPSDVIRTDLPSLLRNALRWGRDLTLGGFVGGGHARALLDASPLRQFLRQHVDLGGVARNVGCGLVRALAVVATDYASGRTFVFIHGQPGHRTWVKARRVAIAIPITVDHLCASAAIPVVFAPVRLLTPYGMSWFGDGCLRLPAPLGPVIRLGARRILAIGLRHRPTVNEPVDTPLSTGPTHQETRPTLAQVLGVALSALFLDQLDSDCEHLERINRLIEAGVIRSDLDECMSIVRPLIITPSIDMAELAHEHFHRMPAQIRYLMGGLGTRTSSNADLVSYLLFDRVYTSALVETGYRDADERRDEIEEFLCRRWT